jgi:heptosyltransferase-2
MNVLLVQLSWLGDCVLSTPLIRGIKDKYPDCSVTVLTTPVAREIFVGHPVVKEVICYDKRGKDKGLGGFFRLVRLLRERNFNKVYSVHRSGRTCLLLWFAGIVERVGYRQSKLPWLFTRQIERPIDKHEVLRGLSLLELSDQNIDNLPDLEVGDVPVLETDRPYIVLFPSSAWFTKQWHGEGFREVARFFREERGYRVIILGSKKEQDYNQSIMSGIEVEDRTGQTSIKETMSLVKGASLVVCNDSFSLHLASAFKRPTVVVFCATSPSFGFGPWNNRRAAVVEMEGLSCKPCRRHGSNVCPTGTNLCMTGVKSERVVRVAEQMMSI